LNQAISYSSRSRGTVFRMTSGVRVWTARGIAAFVDLLQIGLFPFFIEGSVNPLNAVLDVLTCITLICLIGWHIAFLPTFIIEQLPVADLAPTWTLATLIATRRHGREPAGQFTPPPKLNGDERLPLPHKPAPNTDTGNTGTDRNSSNT